MRENQEDFDRELSRKVEQLEQIYQQLRSFRTSQKDCDRMIKSLERQRDRLHGEIMRMNSRGEMPAEQRDLTPIEDDVYDPDFIDEREWRH
jgi:uncharacterized protein (DUF3084 family)